MKSMILWFRHRNNGDQKSKFLFFFKLIKHFIKIQQHLYYIFNQGTQTSNFLAKRACPPDQNRRQWAQKYIQTTKMVSPEASSSSRSDTAKHAVISYARVTDIEFCASRIVTASLHKCGLKYCFKEPSSSDDSVKELILLILIFNSHWTQFFL